MMKDTIDWPWHHHKFHHASSHSIPSDMECMMYPVMYPRLLQHVCHSQLNAGTTVGTAVEWESVRRPQVAELLQTHIVGSLPKGDTPYNSHCSNTREPVVLTSPVCAPTLRFTALSFLSFLTFFPLFSLITASCLLCRYHHLLSLLTSTDSVPLSVLCGP
jgi:hypothetical protein